MFEKLIVLLTALVAAIEANTAALLGSKSTKKEPAAKSETPKPDVVIYPTEEELVAACQPLLALGKPHSDKIKELAAKFGVGKLRELKGTPKAIEAIAALKTALEEAKTASDSGV